MTAAGDIAPQYTGIICGIAASIGNTSGFLVPLTAAAMTPNVGGDSGPAVRRTLLTYCCIYCCVVTFVFIKSCAGIFVDYSCIKVISMLINFLHGHFAAEGILALVISGVVNTCQAAGGRILRSRVHIISIAVCRTQRSSIVQHCSSPTRAHWRSGAGSSASRWC